MAVLDGFGTAYSNLSTEHAQAIQECADKPETNQVRYWTKELSQNGPVLNNLLQPLKGSRWVLHGAKRAVCKRCHD